MDFTELKRKQRATWASGDYSQIARGIQAVADHTVRSARIRAGERVLDLACGTGNATLMARARGAWVTGLDLTPELLAVARKRALDEGYDAITWEFGDAENLPFPDSYFDVVISSCGVMFAPDQLKAASEIARVTKRGGRIALQAWTPEGGVGQMFRVVSTHVPPTPGIPSPFEWGKEERVRALLGSAFREYRFEHSDCPEFAETPEQIADLYITAYGPVHRAYHSLNFDKAMALRKELLSLYRGYVTPADNKVRWGREYMITLATRV